MLAGVGYMLSTAGYVLLLLLLFTVRKPGLAKYLLILATASTALWSASFLLIESLSLRQLLAFDAAKQLIWLVFISACLKDNFTNLIQVLSRPITWFALLGPSLALILPLLMNVPHSWQFLLQTFIALEILIFLEVIYRQAGENQWAYKPLIMYLGATSLFEFVTYANATMVEQIEPVYLTARGYIYAFFIPFLVLAIRRISHWGIDIFVSRDVVMHSSLLLVAGGYLFIMALVGYAINLVGGEWTSTIQLVLIFLSLSLLLILFLSQSVRTYIKVFVTKHFFANQFDYRIEWVKLTDALQGKEENLNQVYAKAVQALVESVDYTSGILLKCEGVALRQVGNYEHAELTSSEIELLDVFSSYCKDHHWIVDVEELRVRPFVYEGLRVNHALLNTCGFHVVVPFYRGDKLWGVAVLGKGEEYSKRLNWEFRDYLWAATAQIASYIYNHEATKEMAETAQFAAFSRMSAFVLHDLKNVLAQIDLILCNAEQHKDNPEFIDDTFETLEHTKARMEKMLRQLTEKESKQKTSDQLCQPISLLEEVIEKRCAGLQPFPQLQVDAAADLVIDKEKLANVLYHLLNNAQQATPDDGEIKVILSTTANQRYQLIEISDTGEGMSQAFISDRLFKPFDTTKGNAGMGIGAYDAKNYLEKIGGQLLVNSKVGQGTTFTLYLPLE